eukprot:TRINITY_DN901_c0_g1_i1.p1 TRINITY_DN901_c0_g1~~TRINITY_DN901_c0_g1_i1.p1  ORF type:complete len:330 (-),score=72.43 TRINITY_DN901_c0_g1_i1:1675-2664(-)
MARLPSARRFLGASPPPQRSRARRRSSPRIRSATPPLRRSAAPPLCCSAALLLRRSAAPPLCCLVAHRMMQPSTLAFASPTVALHAAPALPAASRMDASSVPAACASLLSLRHAGCAVRTSPPAPTPVAPPSPPTPAPPTSRFWQTVLSTSDAAATAPPRTDAPSPPHQPKMNIPCEVCGVLFRKPGHLNMHWRSVHATSAADGALPPRVRPSRLMSSLSSTSSAGASSTTSSRSARSGKAGRAYGCPQCDAWFKRGSDRNRHMRMVHAKIRPFECKLCGNHFGRKSFLEAHILTVHQKLRPFRCECGAAFGQRSSLTRHARKIHNKQP